MTAGLSAVSGRGVSSGDSGGEGGGGVGGGGKVATGGGEGECEVSVSSRPAALTKATWCGRWRVSLRFSATCLPSQVDSPFASTDA